ncbi:formylglycine-generating enzyme family protein [Chamaesiphon sp.]|uniref:formylglycine-generating enzyme family protein n=1 Tax=Chamaesiphon sp. TaxID=2814140 RepID=UPI003593C928
MVLIRGGNFDMGSLATEIDRFESESPQHSVNVRSFFMSEYPIAQIHWWVVVGNLPQIEIPLEPYPSYFKRPGENALLDPVTNINWFEAREFCQRLSRKSGRTYRLPTEAEWEYACRAGTTTPFHFGETITTDLANYRGTDDEELKRSGSYGRGSKGIYRQETTPVVNFPPNAFGLYDMHGNVWEWCQDHWYDNYEGAPIDGSPWLSDDSNHRRVVRGGAWIAIPRNCRSATRDSSIPTNHHDLIGFRVVCEIPTTV